MPMFVGSQSFISIPSFMFVGAAVREICELNRNKEEKKKNICMTSRIIEGVASVFQKKRGA